MKNANAHAAALTSLFVWTITSVAAHYHLVEVTPYRILVAAGVCTYVVLWIGRDGLRGAARRIWNGAGAVVNGRNTSKS